MSEGIPLLILALGTLGGVWFLAAAARKQVADAKGSPERSSVIRYQAADLEADANDVMEFAKREGLTAHARAVGIRTGR